MGKSIGKRGLVLGVALVAVLALVSVLAFGLVQAGKRGVPEEQPNRLALASEIALPFLNGDGQFKLSEFRGVKPVVLNFWFPSCPPCRAEMPDLERLWKQYQGDVALVGVFVPNVVDSEQVARDFLREVGVTYPVVTDARSEAALEYGINAFPTTVFITRDGTVQRRWVGYMDADQMRRFTHQLVAG